MLVTISDLYDYRAFLDAHKSSLDLSQSIRLSSTYNVALSKLRKLDPGLVSEILLPLYSSTGRPAIDPAILLRSFVLMSLL